MRQVNLLQERSRRRRAPACACASPTMRSAASRPTAACSTACARPVATCTSSARSGSAPATSASVVSTAATTARCSIIDGRIGHDGGVNLGDPWASEEVGGLGFLDDMIQIEGPAARAMREIVPGDLPRSHTRARARRRSRHRRVRVGSSRVRVLANDSRRTATADRTRIHPSDPDGARAHHDHEQLLHPAAASCVRRWRRQCGAVSTCACSCRSRATCRW